MPFIQFDGGQMSKEKKAELVAKLTEAAHEVRWQLNQIYSFDALYMILHL